MTVTIYRLPTHGKRGYRGEYPDSIRTFGWSRSVGQKKIAEVLGIDGHVAHIETMNGNRYIVPYEKMTGVHMRKKSLFGQFYLAVKVEEVTAETYELILATSKEK